MFDHLGIVFRDLRMASAFYRAVLAPLGIKLMEDHSGADGAGWLVFSSGEPSRPSSWWQPASQAFGQTSMKQPESGVHCSFTAPSRVAVDRAFETPRWSRGRCVNNQATSRH